MATFSPDPPGTESWQRVAPPDEPVLWGTDYEVAGDPALIRVVREAWPEPDPRSEIILNTLEKTLSINRFWIQGSAWESNHARAVLQQ